MKNYRECPECGAHIDSWDAGHNCEKEAARRAEAARASERARARRKAEGLAAYENFMAEIKKTPPTERGRAWKDQVT
jgi:hypothetical protein